MKVLHVIPTLKRAGAESQVISLSNELINRKDIEVSIFTFNNENDFSKDLSSNVKIYTGYGFSPVGMLSNSIYILSLIKKYGFNVVHAHMFHSILVNRILSIFHSAKIIETFHCSIDNVGKNQEFLLRLTKNIKSYTSFVSNDTMKSFREKNLFSKGSYIPNMIDRKFFCDNKKNVFKSNRWISVGRLVNEKNHRLLIEACLMLRNRGYEYSLDIYGDGYLKEELEGLIEKFGLVNNVFLKGGCQNIEDVYKEYDYFVSTSSIESFGIVFLEAMSQRLPILSTKNEGAIELLVKNDIGYISENNACDVADKMKLIMGMKKEDVEMEINSAFKILTAHYHPKHLTNKWIEIYKEV